MKRAFFCLLIASLLLSSLTGCSQSALLDAQKPVTLTMWHMYGEQADSSMDRLVEEFNATLGSEKGVIIKVTNVSSTNKLTGQLLQARSEAPGAPALPDLFCAHTSTMTIFSAEELIDWNRFFTKDELSAYVSAFLEDGQTEDGALRNFPLSRSTYALFINGSQFARFSADAGVTYDDFSTWDGFFAAAEKYYEWSNGKPFCAFDYPIRHIELDMLSKGDALIYTDDGWYREDDLAFKAAFMRFAAPLVKGHIAVSELYSNTQVMTGETLSGMSSTAAIAYYNDVVTYPDNSSEPMNLKVLPLPQTEGAQRFYPVSGVGLSAIKTTEQKAEAAAVFVRWLTEAERNLHFSVETGYMPVSKSAFAAIDGYAFSDADRESLYTAIKSMHDHAMPATHPDFDGYYAKVDALYAYLRETCPALTQRYANGEDIAVLTEELWDFFRSIA